jgi:valyl-tRNA synthetase
MKPLSEPAIEVVKNGRIRIIPRGWENTYFEWMKNIKDWCISRQIWWGHQIPAWNCLDCKEITVSRKEPERCIRCGGSNIEQERDVLDTWFSSALWPFSTLGWPEKRQELNLFYPTSVLVTSFDILFFWVARMIMIGLRFMKDIPFRDVYIHALVRDAEGQKMSKSKGNIIDPLFMMDRYGTDAFRFTLAAFAVQGRDIRLSKERIEGYRNFVNKLWNASRFTFLNLSDYNGGTRIEVDKSDLKLVDRWILSRLNRTILEVRKALDDYKFNEAANSIYQFIWHEFCDWYIELIKARLIDEGKEKRISQNILVNVLDKSLRLLHPFMPFITEEIGEQLPYKREDIMVSPYPEFEEDMVDDIAEKEMNMIMDLLREIRNIRAEMDIPPSERLKVILNVDNKNKINVLVREKDYICRLARVKELKIGLDNKREESAATAVVDGIEIFIPLEGLIDFKEEKRRLEEELQEVRKDLIFVSKRLSNRDFITNAPPEVVAKDKEKQKMLIGKENKLQENLKSITRMCE